MASILVIDDDELLLKLLEHKLSQAGFQVRTAPDGEIGLLSAQDETPDLIVLDGMMPGIDGFQVLQRLKESPETASIPVIMLTARAMEQDIVSCLSSGAADYLVKPFSPPELVARITRFLNEPGIKSLASSS